MIARMPEDLKEAYRKWRPHWRQDTPGMQLTVVYQCMAGHESNYRDGYTTREKYDQAIREGLEQFSILVFLIGHGEWFVLDNQEEP